MLYGKNTSRSTVANNLLKKVFEVKVYCEKIELMLKLLISSALYSEDTPKNFSKFFTDPIENEYFHKIYEEIEDESLP